MRALPGFFGVGAGSGGGAGGSLPLDGASGIVAAYGRNRLLSAYNGPFADATDPDAPVWYDQVGGRDLTRNNGLPGVTLGSDGFGFQASQEVGLSSSAVLPALSDLIIGLRVRMASAQSYNYNAFVGIGYQRTNDPSGTPDSVTLLNDGATAYAHGETADIYPGLAMPPDQFATLIYTRTAAGGTARLQVDGAQTAPAAWAAGFGAGYLIVGGVHNRGSVAETVRAVVIGTDTSAVAAIRSALDAS